MNWNFTRNWLGLSAQQQQKLKSTAVIHRKRWGWTKIDYDYTLNTRFEHVFEKSRRSTFAIGSVTRDLDRWQSKYPLREVVAYSPRPMRVEHVRLETWRFRPGTDNRQILSEVQEAGADFATADHMIAWMTKHARWLRSGQSWGHPLFTSRPEFLKGDTSLPNALVFWWGGHHDYYDHRVLLTLGATYRKNKKGLDLLENGYLLVVCK